jgi:hypothetical protein
MNEPTHTGRAAAAPRGMRRAGIPARRLGAPAGREGGFVLLIVLFVLLALFVFTAPFLATARNADRASRHLADGAQARLALDAAARRARVQLEASHPAADKTPYFDDIEELSGASHADRRGFDPHDPKGVMWSAEVHDLAGRIDLDSAPPQVYANLFGAVTRLQEPLPAEERALKVGDADALPANGVIWIAGELMRIEGRDRDGRIVLTERGIGATQDKEKNWITEGPRPPANHGLGEHVLDQRALAPIIWRTASSDGVPRDLDTVDQLAEADALTLTGSLTEFGFDALRRYGTTDDGLRAGPEWQRSTRLVSEVTGGETFEIGVEDSRWFGVGSTVRITNGITTELRFIARRGDSGNLFLDRALEFDYERWQAEVAVQVRRPVNVNTAATETLFALFANLGLAGQNSRIDESEARALAALTIESRPFTGLEDWMTRVVLPSAGIERLPDDAPVKPDAVSAGPGAIGGMVLSDARDAMALYLNCLNANDARLAFATMPLCFTSRDTYALELRAAVNGEAGILRTSAVRERVELVTPQANELLHVFARQEDFDESLRLGRRAPWWATGPEATSRFDAGVEPPSRAMAHLGTLDGVPYLPGISDLQLDAEGVVRTPEHVFASREDDVAWCQLAPARVFEEGNLVGRMEHFDHETRDLEGRYLPDETLAYDPSAAEQPVQWAPPDGMLRPLSFEAWFQPRQAGDGTLMAVGGPSAETDRIMLGMEGEDLVLRVLDGFGDHRLTTATEVAEARFPIATSEVDPGLPATSWSHVKVDVQGNRPDQLGLYVNGLAVGVRRPGLTRLTTQLAQGAGVIGVESTEGFPERCVVRIGDELIECTVTGETTFAVQHEDSGEFAGSGGRLARLRWNEVDELPDDLANVSVSHPSGTPVALYGYASTLATDVPTGRAQLPASLGPWRAARVVSTPQPNDMDPVQVPVLVGGLPQSENLGMGWLPATTGELQLALGDDPLGDTDGARVMPAFDPRGGYAALISVRPIWSGSTRDEIETVEGYVVGGYEIVRYSGWTGNAIQIVERNAVRDLPTYEAELDDRARSLSVAPHAFVFVWDPQWVLNAQSGAGTPIFELMNWQTYLLPISLSVPGATQLTFLQATGTTSRFAQITETSDPERTEWVRYDDVDASNGQLVRSSALALNSAYDAITSGAANGVNVPVEPGGGGPGGGGPGGGGPGGGGPGGGGPGGIFDPSEAVAARAVAGAPAARGPRASAAGSDWDPFRGEDPNEDLPLTRSVGAGLHFRGVLGTETGEHAPGTVVVPVFQVYETSIVPGARSDGGVPGAFDPVFLVGDGPAHIGWPMRVHRGHLASSERPRYGWQQPTPGVYTVVEATPPDTETEQGDRIVVDPVNDYETYGRIYVAFDDAAPEVILANTQGTITDSRVIPRLVKFPSGELPRFVTSATVGSGAAGQFDFGIPAASVDEIAFGNTRAFSGLPGASPTEHTAGASLVVQEEVGESDQGMIVEPFAARVPQARFGTGTGTPALSQLRPNGGLLRIGSEIVAYSGLDPSNGGVAFATNGRGLLGTFAQPHQVSEPVAYLEHWIATTLAVEVSADDATLPVMALDEFPPQGLVLIDGELIHYTRLVQGALDMPRRSSEPGLMDENGGGAFRGRFGTAPAGHAAGTAVILFPFRYWDRYSVRFDGPELAYFGFHLDQPNAWWSGVTFDAEESQWGGASLVVLQRTRASAPWDADHEETLGLRLLEDGTQEGDFVPINEQADRIEWRVFARYGAGAFDAVSGLAHGWKNAPRLNHLGVTYYGPGRVLRSVDR